MAKKRTELKENEQKKCDRKVFVSRSKSSSTLIDISEYFRDNRPSESVFIDPRKKNLSLCPSPMSSKLITAKYFEEEYLNTRLNSCIHLFFVES